MSKLNLNHPRAPRTSGTAVSGLSVTNSLKDGDDLREVTQFRIVVERNTGDTRWSAWFHDQPSVVIEGEEAMAAFDLLVSMERERLPDPYQLRVDDKQSRGGHIEVLLTGRARAMQRCSVCKGTGQYVGLSVVEPCSSCGGRGQTPA